MNYLTTFEKLLENYWFVKDMNQDNYNMIKQDLTDELQDFIKNKLGYRLISNPYLIKMEKIPGVPQEFMGIQEFETKLEYVFLCLILIYLEERTRGEQFILSGLIDYIQNLVVEIDMNDIKIDLNNGVVAAEKLIRAANPFYNAFLNFRGAPVRILYSDYKLQNHNIEQGIATKAQGDCLEISAKEDEGVDELLIKLFALSDEGELLYDDNAYTDQPLEFRISEIIREKTISELKDEMPHVIFVEVSDIEYSEEENEVWIRAFINVERDSQKGIVVGKGGENIRRIRKESFKEIKRIFPSSRLNLDLRVKAVKNWRSDKVILDKIFNELNAR